MSSLQKPLHRFKLFPKLPIELRSKVFDMAIGDEEAQIIEVRSTTIKTNVGNIAIFYHETPTPTSTKTSHEFRLRALKVYTLFELTVGEYHLPTNMKFLAHINFCRDTLFFHPSHFEGKYPFHTQPAIALDQFLLALEHSSSVTTIKSLAVSKKFLDNPASSTIPAIALCHLMHAAKSFSKLRLVYDDRHDSPVHDSDKRAIAFTANEGVDQVEHQDLVSYLDDTWKYTVEGGGNENVRAFSELEVVADKVLRE